MRIVDRVREIVSPIVEAEGLELLEVEYIKGKRRSILRLIVDKVGGVTIGECKRLSERVETKLDVADPIPSSYRLEVSSPGVDRPLRTEKEFAVKKGRMVKIKIAKPICGKQEFIGRIEDVQEGRVQIMTEGGRITIPIDSIMNAFVQVQF
jgi:ribosome maturation factor RimP